MHSPSCVDLFTIENNVQALLYQIGGLWKRPLLLWTFLLCWFQKLKLNENGQNMSISLTTLTCILDKSGLKPKSSYQSALQAKRRLVIFRVRKIIMEIRQILYISNHPTMLSEIAVLPTGCWYCCIYPRQPCLACVRWHLLVCIY